MPLTTNFTGRYLELHASKHERKLDSNQSMTTAYVCTSPDAYQFNLITSLLSPFHVKRSLSSLNCSFYAQMEDRLFLSGIINQLESACVLSNGVSN